ncbi:nickel pincer cofactor biosynthesis protein LarC [Streptomonospora nanhaiensis]|uniref:nickel pincer cofactor biosynthesis protein LarC n=2 Tax=Streptomonospora nanhaiensis TaxID=1323731 RepID=UPI001C38050A|nr:nickel pincer cofactor biosynthesis protein LarC [Streptomonospora nanhaiensis]MBV2365425.1 nickel pincer cofactor biosynthesis protein LarC [Streptomonospora nanhaiensis]
MILWLHPFAGISGDMLLGALLDLGAPLDEVRAAVASTGLPGWRLEARTVLKRGISATKAEVAVTDTATARPARVLLDHIDRARPQRAARTAAAAVTAIAEAEARLHGADPAEVHLHEIGGLDTVVDTVGAAAALDLLGVQEVVSAPPTLGRTTVATAHGRLPAPAPATLALLAGVPVTGADIAAETVTPTGAALLRTVAAGYGPPPAMVPVRTGYGAGTRDLPDRPNVLQAVLGEPVGAGGGGAEEPLVVLETNVDDATGEELAHAVAAALEGGAVDAWTSPIVMKKGRPAHTVHALCRPGRAAEVEALLLRHTGSLGMRRISVGRVALPRRTTTADVGGHPVRVKHGPWHAKPEYDDAARAARALGLPLRTVVRRALARSAAEDGAAPPGTAGPGPDPGPG